MVAKAVIAHAARVGGSVLFDGYKRHVLRDLDTGLVPAVGITPANVPKTAVTSDIAADLAAAGLTLSELHIDRAYLASEMARQRGDDLAIFCKAWRNCASAPRSSTPSPTSDSGKAAAPATAAPQEPIRPVPGRDCWRRATQLVTAGPTAVHSQGSWARVSACVRRAPADQQGQRDRGEVWRQHSTLVCGA